MPGSTFDLNERLILAVIQRLQNGEPVIETINAKQGPNTDPPYLIEFPRQILDTAPVASDLNKGFPIVAFIDGRQTLTDDTGWGATGLYEATVAAYVQDPDPRALGWKLRRMSQWLATVLLFGRNMDGGAWGIVLREVTPGRRLSNTDPAGNKSFMSWISITFEAKDEQDTP